MERLIFFCLSITFRFSTPALHLSENELTIALDLSKKLKIDHCIFIEYETKDTRLIGYAKKFSEDFILTTFLTPLEVYDFTWAAYFTLYPETTAFIFKESNATGIENLSHSIFSENDIDVPRYIRYRMSNYVWLAFVNDETSVKFSNENSAIPYDCEFIIIQANDETNFQMTEIFTVENKIFLLEYGTWDFKKGLKTTDKFVYLRRNDLNGTEIPMHLFEENLKMAESRIDRQVMEMLHDISVILNIRYKKIVYTTNNTMKKDYLVLEPIAIVPDTNDTIIQDQQSIGQDPIFGYSYYFMFFFDYHHGEMNNNPVFKINVNWYIKHPETKLRPDFYVPPFQEMFWLAIIFSILFGSILVVVIRRLAPEQEKRYITDDVYMGLEYLCNQCGNDEIKNLSLRIASLSLRSIFVIVMASFGAVVTSYLAVKIPTMPFVDLQSFFQNGEYKIMADREYINVLMKIYNAVSHEMFNRIYMPLETENDIDRICQEKIAYIDIDWKIGEKNISCNLYRIDKPIGFITVCLYDQTSPFRRPFNYRILRFYESGISNRMREIITETSFTESDEEDSLQPIELQHMIQVLTMPLIGSLIAAVLASCEFVYKKSKIFKNCSFHWRPN